MSDERFKEGKYYWAFDDNEYYIVRCERDGGDGKYEGGFTVCGVEFRFWERELGKILDEVKNHYI